MYKKAFILLFIVSLMFMTGCFNISQPKMDLVEYTIEDVLAIDFKTTEYIKVAVPYSKDEKTGSFEIKEIADETDRMKIYELLKDAALSEAAELEKTTGFDVIIEVKAENPIYIVLNKTQLLINDKRYYLSGQDLGAAAKALYETMDYEAVKLE